MAKLIELDNLTTFDATKIEISRLIIEEMPAITLNHSIISIVSLLYFFSFRHSVPPAQSEKTLDYQMPVWSNNKSLI